LSVYESEDCLEANKEFFIVKPENGSVAFGSGKECWAFTVTKFA